MDLKDILLKTPKDQLAKAVGDAYGLQGIHDIRDLWDDMHKIPTAEEITHGPAAAATGAAAEKMVAEYSNPSAQVGLVKEYQNMEQLIENWGTTIKSTISTSFGDLKGSIDGLVAKAFPPKEDKEEKEEKHEDKKEKMKKADPIQGFEALVKLTKKLAKADIDKNLDAEQILKAHVCFEKAEKRMAEAKELEKSNPELAGEKAFEGMRQVEKALKALEKANVLSRYGLVGHGNQADAAVPDEARGDDGPTAKADMSPKKAAKIAYKARLHAAKAAKFRAMLGGLTKAEKEDEEKKEKHEKHEEKHEAKKATPESERMLANAVVPDQAQPNPADVSAKAEGAPEVPAQQGMTTETVKALNERIAQLEAAASAHRPAITPIILKSGLKNESTATTLITRIYKAQEFGELTSDGVEKALSLVDRFRSAANGHISVDIVEQQLAQAPSEVRMFFDTLGQQAV